MVVVKRQRKSVLENIPFHLFDLANINLIVYSVHVRVAILFNIYSNIYAQGRTGLSQSFR
ncbi:MAG: hypothetical protein BGO88_08385 [Flavobacterium sp. 38-13]|nr:MAG: hypothetical protein BGO88_08385 [Flavobacterium sp. 38-13]